MLKIQYKRLVNNKKLIAAFKQKIRLCLIEHLFWLGFNFFLIMYEYISVDQIFPCLDSTVVGAF